MNNNEITYVTMDGLQKIEDELAYLRDVRSAEIAEQLAVAIADGELDQNPQYEDAKKAQAIVSQRIRQLNEAVKYAVIVADNPPSDAVCIGSKVQISEEGWDEIEEYRIVGVVEAEPAAGLISNKSPIGRALLGAKIGDIVAALTPAGETHFRVLAIA